MRRRIAVLAALAALGGSVPAAVAEHGRGQKPAIYLVGGGVESINPTPAMLQDDFNLGGYGFGSGKIAERAGVPGVTDAFAGRQGTFILGDRSFNRFPSADGTYESDGVHSRAFAVSDRTSTIVLAQIETQGYFNAYKQGPFGENEIRQDAAAAISALAAKMRSGSDPSTRPGRKKHGRHLGGQKPRLIPPVPTASQIVVDSDHSHSGPDTAGVWGGVPTSYLKLVHDRTVAAIVDAWKAMRPATLSYGIAHAGVNTEQQYPPQECINAGKPDCSGVSGADWILNNQFSNDPANQDMDDEIRVLQARDPDSGAVVATYVNYASHPTVLDSDNTGVSADYVGRLDVLLEKSLGGFAMDQVATLGREQPARADCTDSTIVVADHQHPQRTPAFALCMLDQYAQRVVTKVKEALELATPLSGAPIVAMNSYLLTDMTTSAVLAGVSYAGAAIGVPAGRSINPPWYTGTLLGTTYYVGRIGSVLVTGGPGEMYAQIWQKVKDTVTADHTSGITSVMNIGTAGDFLGYIVAPLEAYPEPIRRSMFSGDPPPNGDTCQQDPLPSVDSPIGCPDPIGNDNYFFNISHTFGERLTCDFLRGAGDVLKDDPTVYWKTYVRCPAFANDLALAPGSDMKFPQQPDLSAELTHM